MENVGMDSMEAGRELLDPSTLAGGAANLRSEPPYYTSSWFTAEVEQPHWYFFFLNLFSLLNFLNLFSLFDL
jgi:hypothetical protein